MADDARVIYLADVETAASSTRDDVSTAPSASQDNASASASASNPLKRQRTLMDMFTAPKDARSEKTGQPETKKAKLDTLSSSSGGVANIKIAGSAGLQRLNFIPFSLSEFIESIPEDQRHLLKLECDCMGKSWQLLKDEIKKPYFISLKKSLWEEGVKGPDDNVKSLKVYPTPRNIYSWSNTPLGKVRVVIIGQDPYHGPNQAHGLCFSVPKGVTVPPSLRNIYAEIKAEYPEFKPPQHGNLTAWAENGVLMLNTCLTVKANQAGSHAGRGWEEFTDKVVDVVDKYGGANLGGRNDPDGHGIGRGVVFLAWGAWAGKRVAKLKKTKHLILTSAHPSPFSANKGFLGNGHFKAANDWLEKKYGGEGRVNWCQLDTAA
ncbi:uracil-DNA glycosylase-like protein [Butyriboletus roseoflavus]|nr:uracil-DNA glycosylase-like protein [Butyriboletus roseoflavus]